MGIGGSGRVWEGPEGCGSSLRFWKGLVWAGREGFRRVKEDLRGSWRVQEGLGLSWEPQQCVSVCVLGGGDRYWEDLRGS